MANKPPSSASGREMSSIGELQAPNFILEHIHDSIILCDTNGNITFWSKGAARQFGYSEAEILGTSMAILYPIRNKQELPIHLKDLMNGIEYDGEWEALRRDSTRVWMHTRRNLLRNTEGKPIGFINVSKDITRQKKEMEAVRQSEQLYRAAGESINYGVWSCDAQGRLTHLSESFMALLGLTRAQNLSDGWLNALRPEVRGEIMEAWRECLRTNKPWRRQYEVLGVDGEYHSVLTLAAPVVSEDGKVICWAGLNLDIDQLS